jgi:hypothetical protein
MNFEIKLVLFLLVNIYFNNVNGQDTLNICNDTVPASYRKMVLSQERKEIDSEILYSYKNIEDTLSITDSIYCEYILKYIDCEGYLGNYSNVPIGDNLCEFLADKSILVKVHKSSIGAFINITQFGNNYIVFQYSLITGLNNDVWYFFERNVGINEDKTFPNKK